jgi:hypothetical protein
MEATSPISPTGPSITTIKVLFAVYAGVSGSDVLSPLEVLTKALHNPSDPCTSHLPLYMQLDQFQ